MTSTYDQCFLFVVLASRVFAIRILSPRIVFICLLDRYTVMFCSIPVHHLSNYTIVQRLLPRSTPLAVLRHHRELYSEECKYTTVSQRYSFSSPHTARSSSNQSVSPFYTTSQTRRISPHQFGYPDIVTSSKTYRALGCATDLCLSERAKSCCRFSLQLLEAPQHRSRSHVGPLSYSGAMFSGVLAAAMLFLLTRRTGYSFRVACFCLHAD